jgi:hypothetical protein
LGLEVLHSDFGFTTEYTEVTEGSSV